MTSDLVIRNARVWTDGREVAASVRVENGLITAIGEVSATSIQEIDATGLLLLPGGIDSHCHMDQRPVNGEPVHPDDFITATSAAAAGGVTTVIPQSMCPRGGDPETLLAEYLAKAAGRAVVDYSAHIQMAEADPGFLRDRLPVLAAEGFASLKIFTTYEGYTLTDPEILAILDAAARNDVICLIHAEDDALLRYMTARMVAEGQVSLVDQPDARPEAGEAEMIRRVANYASVTGARVHIFHVTGRAAVAEITAAAARGVRISGETCPHYATFTREDLARPDFEGAKFLCSPALRTADDRDLLWAALADGRLSVWSSDHSPAHRMPQIARALAGEVMPFTAFSGGMPGLQTLLPILFSEGVVKGRITLARFVELTAGTPARLFGLAPAKGEIRVGADADLVLWDPARTWTIRRKDMYSRIDFTPWEGMDVTGRPLMTFSRGRLVAQDGIIAPGGIGHGRLAARTRAAA